MRAAGAASVDITPRVGLPLAGFSLIGQPRAVGVRGRLFATVLALREGEVELALVTVDLVAGMEDLHHAVRSHLRAAGVPWARGQLYLMASHTHAGPGGMFEAPFYNRNASNSGGHFPELADAMGARIAHAILRARAEAVEAEVHHRSVSAWGLHANKSLKALDPSDLAALHARFPPPPGTDPEEGAVDPRVRVIWASRPGEATPIGVIAVFGAHPCAIDPLKGLMSSDSFGCAARAVRDALWERHRAVVPVGLAVGTHADVNLQLPGRIRDAALAERTIPDEHLAIPQTLGALLAERVLAGLESAPLRGGLAWRGQSVPMDVPDAAHPLSRDPDVGMVAMGGSEFGRFHLLRMPTVPWYHPYLSFKQRNAKRYARLYPEGSTRPRPSPWSPLQWTKRVGLKADLVSDLFGGAPPKRLHMSWVRIGELHLLGLPFELTVMTGQRLEGMLRDQVGDIGLLTSATGGYASYLTTRTEYEAQHYEGAATLWGIDTGPWVEDRVRDLLQGPEGEAPPGPALVPAPLPERPLSSSTCPVQRSGCLVEGLLPEGVDPSARPLWDGPVVCLMTLAPDGSWEPLTLGGVPVDDRTRAIELSREPTQPTRWRWRWVLPEALAQVALVGARCAAP
ncbi:MAG: neutral/alkaline non-lysosomal ceramidase N-terminal domain-containing protein [Deltaproteobacteria bacterium]|nr:neutral/alkaline non-lysosomal ceramidase N-terminal domain-containing protein [Deltaproteobacteria bacterium]